MNKAETDWCLDPTGWKLDGDRKTTYDIRELENTEEDRAKYYDKIFYKEKYIESYDNDRDTSFNYSRIITFSLKYRDFLASKRYRRLTGPLKPLLPEAEKI